MIVPDLIIKAATQLDRWERHWEGIREDIESWAHGLYTDRGGMDAYRLRFRSMVEDQKGLADSLRAMINRQQATTRAAENERLRRALEHAENVCSVPGVSENVSVRWLREQMQGAPESEQG